MALKLYCFKCKKYVPYADVIAPKMEHVGFRMEKGRDIVKGTCPYCHSKISNFAKGETAKGTRY